MGGGRKSAREFSNRLMWPGLNCQVTAGLMLKMYAGVEIKGGGDKSIHQMAYVKEMIPMEELGCGRNNGIQHK